MPKAKDDKLKDQNNGKQEKHKSVETKGDLEQPEISNASETNLDTGATKSMFKVGKKLFLGFGIMIAIMVIMGLVVKQSISEINHDVTQLAKVKFSKRHIAAKRKPRWISKSSIYTDPAYFW